MKYKLDLPRLIAAFLFAAMVITCLSPFCNKLLNWIFPDRNIITIHVLAENQQVGGSEVWLTASHTGIDLEHAPQHSRFNGKLEYRLATEYGYGFNFLVSYGENIGSEITIAAPRGGGAPDL